MGSVVEFVVHFVGQGDFFGVDVYALEHTRNFVSAGAFIEYLLYNLVAVVFNFHTNIINLNFKNIPLVKKITVCYNVSVILCGGPGGEDL